MWSADSCLFSVPLPPPRLVSAPTVGLPRAISNLPENLQLVWSFEGRDLVREGVVTAARSLRCGLMLTLPVGP